MDLLPLLQATGTLVALLLLSKIWMSKNNTTNKHFIQAPQPKGAWPILGHLHLLGGQIPLFRTLAAMADQHGPIFTIRLGFRQAVVVSSKQTVTECFTVNDRAFMSRPQTAALKYMGYNGALSALGPSDDYWRQLRKVTTHELLSNRHLESFKHVRALEMDLSIKELYSLSIKNECKMRVSEWFWQVTMNMMLRAIVGKRYSFGDSERDKEARQFARTMEEFMYLNGVSECSDVIPGIEWLDLQGNVKAMKKNSKEIDYFMSMWLEEHVQNRREGKVKKDERDFMDVLLSCFPEDGDGLVFGHKSQDIIKATALSLILGGSDTTTATLSWAVSLLLNHPTTLKAAQKEIDMYVGHGNVRWLDESDTKNLVYLQAIIKETLRLYPPGPLSIPRESIQDCHVSGYYVPKGTRLIVNVWKLHRDPHIWTNPDEFRPERFLAWQAKEDLIGQQFELLPFGAGRRSCPGSTLAYKIMHLILARLLQGFNLEMLSRNGKVNMSEGLGLVLNKATPLEVLLIPRLSGEFYHQP
ncbi:Xanthotoxin 5-hydroxylase CYP82C4 [Camellia lanceoleosa]|uniref:Xanthotoxin 5-hydroxylase CYP82C4 n=1 Tax=Camellia lanceoleosa TaxID=1840588 RepID=A0ACC0HIN8_9ERIC|nr:Xanthotoxin 5-hydroxylase CYP82C4 [Camellia lanceoleosa]